MHPTEIETGAGNIETSQRNSQHTMRKCHASTDHSTPDYAVSPNRLGMLAIHEDVLSMPKKKKVSKPLHVAPFKVFGKEKLPISVVDAKDKLHKAAKNTYDKN